MTPTGIEGMTPGVLLEGICATSTQRRTTAMKRSDAMALHPSGYKSRARAQRRTEALGAMLLALVLCAGFLVAVLLWGEIPLIQEEGTCEWFC